MGTPANALDITQAGLVKFDGVNVFSGVTTTNHDVLVGAASNGITNVAPSATTGLALISNGAAADPSFGTVSVAGGGTGAVTLTGVLIGNGTSAITASPVTQYDVLVGGASNAVGSVGPGSAGQILQSGGAAANPAYSTATYPSTSGTSGTLLQSNGTNFVNTTAAYPATAGTSGTILISNGTNIVNTTATYPTTAGTSGNVMTSNGTNWVSSAPANSIVTLTGTLTSTQIKNLKATPIVAIPAPGSGKVILIGSSLLKLNYAGTNAFSAAVAQSIHLVYTSLTYDIRPVMVYTEINGTVDGIQGTETIAEPQGLFSTFDDVAVSFTVDGAAEIGGNAANDNTITWMINYQIVTI